MRWMDLESVILSEVRKRKKQIPYANAYIWNLKKIVLMNLVAGQEYRCRHREWT